MLRKVQKIPAGHASENYVCRRIHAQTKDGERVPITVVHRKVCTYDFVHMHMYDYLYICVCVYVCVCRRIHAQTKDGERVPITVVHRKVCIYVYIQLCTIIYTYVCVYDVCICMCM